MDETTYRLEIDGIDTAVALDVHCGAGAARVRSLKYGRRTGSVTVIADAMAAVAPPADVVTWVPASRRRRRRRGFDQSELLARAVARRLGLPVRRLLRRLDDRPQTARDRDGRRHGPALRAAGRPPTGSRVLLLDDVATTGASLAAAAATVAANGASSVVAVVATAAPPHGGASVSGRL